MGFYKGQCVKIVANHAGHRFKLGEIVEIRTDASYHRGLSAYHLNHKGDLHGVDYWWVNSYDIIPAKAVIL